MTHPAARPVGLILLLFLLIPSAAYLWRYDDLPQFCEFHDDCIYFVSAKSLAAGQGYTLPSLPEPAFQTKHPPLYPALLALAWKIDPRFPQNLPVAAWISWLALPALLLLFSNYLPRMGFTGGRAWILLTLFALNPYVIWFSSQLLSELLFMALLMGVFLLLEKGTQRAMLAAGILGGLAYLTRSAGLAILPGAAIYLWLRGARREAGWFAMAMLPFVIGWNVWARMHLLPTDDIALLYYLDYAAYERLNIQFDNAHLFLWKNVDGLLYGLGSLVLPKITGSLLLKITSQVISVAMISGIVRLWKADYARLYALYALFGALLLLIWHFPPDERFVLPFFPLALAGLITELAHLISMLRAGLRHRDAGQRVVAGGLIGATALIFGGALALQLYVAASLQPMNASISRMEKVDRIAAYGWARVHTSADTRFLAYADPAFYLYTRRPVIRQPLLPKLWYTEDHAGMVALWGQLEEFARKHRLRYYLFSSNDLGAVSEEDRAAIEKLHQSSLKTVFHKGTVTVYEFPEAAAVPAQP